MFKAGFREGSGVQLDNSRITFSFMGRNETPDTILTYSSDLRSLKIFKTMKMFCVQACV